MTGRNGRKILGFCIEGTWGSTFEVGGWVCFSDLIRSDQIGLNLNRQWWIEILDARRCAARGGGVSIVWLAKGSYDLRHSPRVAKNWRQKEINPFVSESNVLLLLLLRSSWPYNMRSCVSSSTFLSFSLFVWVPPLSIVRRVLSILQEGLPWILSLWWDFSSKAWCPRIFLFFCGTIFLLSLWSLYNGIGFQYSLILVISFSKNSYTVLIWQFNSFCCFSSVLFIISEAHFLMANSISVSWLYILLVCRKVSSSFSFLTDIII